MPDHAILSASSSERWTQCPPSARLNAQEPDNGSPFAMEGTDAHSLCQYLVLKALGHRVRDPTEDLTYYNAEMQEAAEGYCAFVLQQTQEAKLSCSDPLVCIEERVDFSRWVPEGFGTADCLIAADDLLQIIDFKFGTGVPVSAEGPDRTGNSQLKCYALGALDTYGSLYDIRRVRLTIYQPRLSNVSSFEMRAEDLLGWADEVLIPAARQAAAGSGEFCPGEHCRFCKVKGRCRARADHNLSLAQYEFAKAPTLSLEEIADILPRIDELTSWAKDVKDFAQAQALSGISIPHFKLVEGRSNRKYTDEAKVAEVVAGAGFDPYERRLLGITEMTKQLGKNKFNELLGGLVFKPPGKPVLVPDTDKRPELSTAANDFTEEK